MLEKIFDINKSNIFEDSNNYYFFRALEEVDLESIENKELLDADGHITRLMTDREFYGDNSRYNEDSEISLEEMVSHIKINYDRNTNCISFTSNANIANIYGRDAYDNQYIVIKVPKSELNKTVYQAGLYMLQEVEKKLEEISSTKELTDMQKYLLSMIDNVRTKDQLDRLKEMIPKEFSLNRDLFEGGLEFDLTDTARYYSLTDEQNFEKDKIVMKIDVLNEQILSRMSNRFLIRTIGGAFSSTEIIHYKDVPGDYINIVDPDFMDILGLAQQLPSDMELVSEFKQDLISLIGQIKINEGFNYGDYQIDNKKLSIDDIYEITQGRYRYKEVQDLYNKMFYLAKSKLRTRNSVALLKNIFPAGKYDELFNYMLENAYGIEPEITNRKSRGMFQISESVSLNLNNSDEQLLEFINSLNTRELENVLENTRGYLEEWINILPDNDMRLSREDWYANTIIDSVDFKRLKVHENLSMRQRNDIIRSLKSHNFLDVYNRFNTQGLTEVEIADKLLTSLIREKDISELDEKETFSLEELEWFVGYNRVKNSTLTLRDYQVDTLESIDRIFEDKQFASAILPTGSGKSYVAIAKMLENPNQKILYLAPNVEILNQLTDIVRNTLTPEEHIGDKDKEIMQRVFPNLVLDTYQHLKEDSASEIINGNYDLIIFDELHRTGATEWKKKVEALLNNQNEKVKVLGITATPERDVDLKDMTDHWAQYYGYSDEEIIKGKHLAKNMTIADAIRMGIIANPRIVNCEYSLISDGTLDELKMNIDNIKSDGVRNEDLIKYENLRRQVENSEGIESILNKNLQDNGKYIVFLPVTKRNDGTYEDEDGNAISSSQAEKRVKDYQTLVKQYLYSYNYLNDEDNQVSKIYEKIKSNEELTIEDMNYLESEKENIQLLTKIDIYGKPNALNTKTNILADEIIEYMNWEKLSVTRMAHELNERMKDEVEDYSMLGSYSDKKNKRELQQFNEEPNGKKKLMFVMNKLNEGVHVDDISGIIWLRPLDTNSRILYLQQLGRCISALNPGEEISEDKRPLVLDLANNTLKVNLDERITQEEKDLAKLLLIESWIMKNNKIPEDLNNTTEREFSNSLRKIQSRYLKYVDDENLLQDKNVTSKLLIKEIIEHGSNIDLWNINLPEIDQDKTTENEQDNQFLEGILSLNPVYRDFLELNEEVENNLDTIIAHIEAIIKYCNTEPKGWPKRREKEKTANGYTGDQLVQWLNRSGYNKGEFKYNSIEYNGRNVKEILDELWDKYGYIKKGSEDAIIDHIIAIVKYCNTEPKGWPKYGEREKTANGYTGGQLALWLDTSGYYKGEFKYSDIEYNGRNVKEILDELLNKYGYIKRGSEDSIIDHIIAIVKYCNTEPKGWPKRTEKEKTANGYTGGQLAQWLNTSGYYKGEFKYSDIEYNGRNVKEILDELWNKYGYIKKGSEDAIIDHIIAIIKYCNTEPKGWPKRREKEKTANGYTGGQLASWLYYSGYDKGEFKYNDIKYNGRNVKEILDELWDKYGSIKRGSEDSVINHIIAIVKYCNTEPKGWPKQREKEKTANGYIGDQLASWLYYSGYYKGEFKYSDIEYNGRNVKEILDELWDKYGSIKQRSEDAIIDHIIAIVKYCNTEPKGWPKQGEKEKTANGYTGDQLAQWLYDSGYNKGEFKYSDIEYNGRNIKEILDELWDKYGYIKRGSEEAIINYIIAIIKYCNTEPKGWPKPGEKEKTANGYTGDQLAQWLNNSGYNKGEFKYSDIEYNGRNIKEILDELWNEYGSIKLGSEEDVIDHIIAIVKYCNTEPKGWPKQGEKKKTANGYTGEQLAWWLNKSGYNKGEFKYSDIEYNGRNIKEILDELWDKYGYIKQGSEEAIINYIIAIIKYCNTEPKGWPKRMEKEKTVGGYTGNQLAQWLYTSGYNKGEFKYSDIEYEGRSIKDILDTLHKYYKEKAREEYDSVKAIFDMYSEFVKVEESINNKEVTNGKQIL